MKKSIRKIILFIGTIFLMSCTVSHVNSQLIIGNWKKERLGPYIKGNNSKQDTLLDIKSMVEFKKIYQNAEKEQVLALREIMYSGISFQEDKMATLSSGKKKIHGIWKMNAKGNKIVVKDTATSTKHFIYIVTLDSFHLKISQPVIDGSLQQSYMRQK